MNRQTLLRRVRAPCPRTRAFTSLLHFLYLIDKNEVT